MLNHSVDGVPLHAACTPLQGTRLAGNIDHGSAFLANTLVGAAMEAKEHINSGGTLIRVRNWTGCCDHVL